MKIPRAVTIFLAAIIGLALAGCGAAARAGDPAGSETPAYRPPTQAAPPAPTPQPTAAPTTAAAPAASGECQNNLVFIADQTIPDGTVVGPESTLDKRWEVENTGNCNWDEKYRIRLIAGSELGAQPEQALYPARGGSRAVIRIVFQAPSEPGSYRSAWQAHDPQGEPFGDPFFIDIVVEAP